MRYEHAAPGRSAASRHQESGAHPAALAPRHRRPPGTSVTGIGGEFLHVAIDDHSRIAFTALYPDETEPVFAPLPRRRRRLLRRLGIAIRRVLTDNGPCFYAHHFAHACRDLGINHKRTRLYTPRTNGKAERFIQTAIREWAYARRYENSEQRAAQLKPWTHLYNWHRPHASLNQDPPISRSGLDVNNLLTHHS